MDSNKKKVMDRRVKEHQKVFRPRNKDVNAMKAMKVTMKAMKLRASGSKLYKALKQSIISASAPLIQHSSIRPRRKVCFGSVGTCSILQMVRNTSSLAYGLISKTRVSMRSGIASE